MLNREIIPAVRLELRNLDAIRVTTRWRVSLRRQNSVEQFGVFEVALEATVICAVAIEKNGQGFRVLQIVLFLHQVRDVEPDAGGEAFGEGPRLGLRRPRIQQDAREVPVEVEKVFEARQVGSLCAQRRGRLYHFLQEA